jgi:hypothetical protein
MDRQTTLLSGAVPGWPPGVGLFQDPLTTRQKRAHQPDSLVQRANMLRPTTRRDMGTIFVASLAVLAWGEEDFRDVLAATRRAKIVSVGDDLEIPRGPIDEDSVVEAWKAARKNARLRGASLKGAAISAERRKGKNDAGIDRIRERWGMPNSEWSTLELRRIAGEPGKPLAYNTISARLKGREEAQRLYQIKMKRQARKAKTDG